MASLQLKGTQWYCQFIYFGKRFTLALGEISKNSAFQRKVRAEELLTGVKRGTRELPPGVSISDFIDKDGKAPVDPAFAAIKETTLADLRTAYVETFSNGAIEANTLYTIKVHLRHLEATFGKRFLLSGLTHGRLQEHINRRQSTVSPVTIKKEIDSFRAVFNWGLRAKLVTGTFPSHGLVYPKTTQKLPFMTWAEIERRIKAGGDPDELWEALFLDSKQIADLLKFVKAKPAPTWFYPMILMACHTGMRRSELIRAMPEDIDIKGGMATIREKKRARGTLTTRRVPLSTQLADILKPLLKENRQYLFGQGERPLSVQATQKAFVRVLKGSKYANLKGYHVCRHSFISALAATSTDQRLIDEFAGHSTEQQRRRYRHLAPAQTRQAIKNVFG